MHDATLPGKPDLVFRRHRAVVFVHGCFWHRHSGCGFATTPRTNELFWKKKFAANVRRDRLAINRLTAAGWRVLVLWECGLRNAGFESEIEGIAKEIVHGSARFLEWPRTRPRSIADPLDCIACGSISGIVLRLLKRLGEHAFDRLEKAIR
jgi:DNA mismatch endonuclease (patch repair protein)